jgi:succinate dehydrogenase / fumarate reductase membrane anchor subunit
MTDAVRRPRTIYANPSRAARPLPEASGRERFWWYFMRVSGLLLVLLALGHMFIMHVLVELTGNEIDFALLLLAFVHGANGTRVVIGDWVANRTIRGLLVGLLLALSAIWLVLGMAVILFFDPGASTSASLVR